MASLGINDHSDVCNACNPVSANWRRLGARLGVLEPTLAKIEHDHRFDAERCLSTMITKRLSRPRGEVRDNVEPLTWKSLCEALSYVDKTLAEEIARNHDLDTVAVDSPRSHGPQQTTTSSQPGQQFTLAGGNGVDDRTLPSDGKTLLAVIKATKNITDWSLLPLELGITQAELDRIKEDNQTADDRHKAIIHKWLGYGRASWAFLVSALRECGVDQGQFVADEIAKQHPKV